MAGTFCKELHTEIWPVGLTSDARGQGHAHGGEEAALVFELLSDLAHDKGQAVLMVTHDQRSALALSDRVVIMEAKGTGGEIIQDAQPAFVYQRPVNAAAARLTGTCAFIDAHASGNTAESSLGPLSLIESKSGPVQAMLRPEQIVFTLDPEGDAIVEDVMFSGSAHKVVCQGQSGTIEASLVGHHAPPAKGERGSLHIHGPVWTL